jgi:uncharacterized Zn-finger protein
VHNDLKPYKCLNCGLKFCRSSALKQHSLVCSELRDFKCTICEKGFKRKGDLDSHLRVHGNKREFECKICAKSFKTTRNLKEHHQNSSIKQRRTSSGKSFKRKYNLKLKTSNVLNMTSCSKETINYKAIC